MNKYKIFEDVKKQLENTFTAPVVKLLIFN